MIGTLIVGLVMEISLNPEQLLMLRVLSSFMCLTAGALAMIVIGLIKSNRMANIAIMLVTMPQMFLSHAIIPINNSSDVLFVLNRVMPMTYCLDLARAVVYAGTPEYGSIGLVRQPILLNPIGFGLSNKSRKILRILPIFIRKLFDN
jgi:ABC-2 type transport system permease protein